MDARIAHENESVVADLLLRHIRRTPGYIRHEIDPPGITPIEAGRVITGTIYCEDESKETTE